MADVVIPLKLVVFEEPMRRAYDDYVADVAWYRANDPEKLKGPPSHEYGSEAPIPFERWSLRWIEGCLGDAIRDGAPHFRIEQKGRVGSG